MLRKRNLYIARSLALVAVFFIIAFQVFWLNQVYVNKKEEKIKDAEQLLAEKILESERNKIAGTVTLSDKNSSISANVSDVIKNLNTASTKELNNAVTTSSLKKLQDSKITDASFTVHLPMNTTDPAKDCKIVYDLLRQNSFFSNGNMPFYLMYSFHNTQYIYPAKKNGYTDNTAPVFAHLAPLSFYRIMFPGLFAAILKSMTSSFIVFPGLYIAFSKRGVAAII